MIVTVTLNAAFARTITVPNFQRGQRHRASAGLPLAGGKGLNVARALKILGVPVVATGLAGGQAGLRLGVEAEPCLVSPNQREAEGLVGQEFHDDEDFQMGLDQIAEMGARNVLITTEFGCYALLREERTAYHYRVEASQVEPVSTVGAGDTLLAAFLAARVAGRTREDALRAGVAAGAASTLELGAGIFDPRQAARFQGGVTLTELAPLAV